MKTSELRHENEESRWYKEKIRRPYPSLIFYPLGFSLHWRPLWESHLARNISKETFMKSWKRALLNLLQNTKNEKPHKVISDITLLYACLKCLTFLTQILSRKNQPYQIWELYYHELSCPFLLTWHDPDQNKWIQHLSLWANLHWKSCTKRRTEV